MITKIDITGEQARRIDELVKNDFEGATKEDIQLYAAWCVKNAVFGEEVKAIQEAIKDEYEMRKKIFADERKRAEDRFSLLKTFAMERYIAALRENEKDSENVIEK